MEQQFSLNFDSLNRTDGEKKENNKGNRSILVRGLPNHLSSEQSKEALRQLFSGAVRRTSHLQLNPRSDQRSQGGTSMVPAREGPRAQSSWRQSNFNPQESAREAAQRKDEPPATQSKERPKEPRGHFHGACEGGTSGSEQLAPEQLLQQLPYSVSSIRVATDGSGGSIYAVVDFTHELLANLALQLLGETTILPNTSTQVRLSLYETWATPLVVDQYHLYVSGIPPGAAAAQVEEILTSAAGIPPTHVKVSSIAGMPSRRGVQEYAFLRYSDEETAEEVLKKLTTLACAWSSRTLSCNEEEPLDDSWEREEEAYAVMSAQCMDYEEPAQPPSALSSGLDIPTMSPRASAKRSATEAAGSAFWLSILAENGPVTLSELCSTMKRRQRELQQWHEQEWEEDTTAPQAFPAPVSESVAQ
ncbi:RNA recognition motif domain-containing protein, putative [Eimeria praecox]|uniref:RNA recognition motif domain-containing protein, putative n=1 Tax=Eimeria praecox TaxID=51316 RepID=U6G2Z3_9EIME|nr:RNA recognition motif domain-containing protein, putative [Eimeria praecox]